MKRIFLSLLLAISFSAQAMEEDIESTENITLPKGILCAGETRTGKTYIDETCMKNTLTQTNVMPLTRETPADRFASRIAHLPYEVRRRAWGHFEQKDYLCKGRMTLEDAEDLAKLYQEGDYLSFMDKDNAQK